MNKNARSAYLGASVETASPERLLLMLLERMVLDVRRGLNAQNEGDRVVAHVSLLHAQDIVDELRRTLRTDSWAGAKDLQALYDYLYRRLIAANAFADTAITEECLRLAEELSDTFHQAAAMAVVQGESA